ncbi:MAG: hypothetical protein FWG81_07165 [Betaproteobacteria bacterium]|nr:hypothetical protein [Betaproteobacteria bacterium]
MSLLPNDDLFIYGNGVAPNEWRSHKDQVDALRTRRGVKKSVYHKPKLYDAKRHGWLRLPDAPECTGAHYLHTATVLANGQVLIAGGLCDMPKSADEAPLQRQHVALSIWDSASRQWQSGSVLVQDRIFHSATLMPDGSVLLTGGESDPAWESDIANPVLASVERYASGQISAVLPMYTARAKHSATALPDGRLLVVGGLDANGRPITSAELLDARANEWLVLPPLRTARHSHTATLLTDDRVLVTGGVGMDGRTLRSVEMWDPETGNWAEGPELPLGLYGHAAAQLASGEVLVAGGGWVSLHGQVPWAWSWSPQSATWELAGSAKPANPGAMSSPVSIVPQSDGSALIFTPIDVLRWRAGAAPDTMAPVWYEYPPALAKLPKGRLMTIGYTAGVPWGGVALEAHIWDSATDRWSHAGALESNLSGRIGTKALALPSGRVIYVGNDRESKLRCNIWNPVSNDWSSCGSLKISSPRNSLQLDLLPDGRAFALANWREAAVFDEPNGRWMIWSVSWNSKGLTYGMPIRVEHPVTTITDPVSGQSFEVNDAGARFQACYYSAWTSPADYRPATIMLWNAQAGWWDYVMHSILHNRMGINARRLPDGCAISTHDPIALYRPQDAKVVPLPNPGFGTSYHTMVVMDDGTVVTAGAGAGSHESGAGFFYRKASCAGFAPAPEGDQFISPAQAVDPVVTESVEHSPAQPTHSTEPSWWQSCLALAMQYKWVFLVCLGTFVAYRLLRRLPLRRVSGRRSLIIRLIFYCALAFVLIAFGQFFYIMVNYTPPWVRKNPAEERWSLQAAWQKALDAVTPTKLPCNLIGVWSSTHRGMMRRIELKDDGRYFMAPSIQRPQSMPITDVDPKDGYTGQWWVIQDNIIVWKDDRMNGFLDKNPMLDVAEGRFQVIEANGERTKFELIEAKPSTRCDKT